MPLRRASHVSGRCGRAASTRGASEAQSSERAVLVGVFLKNTGSGLLSLSAHGFYPKGVCKELTDCQQKAACKKQKQTDVEISLLQNRVFNYRLLVLQADQLSVESRMNLLVHFL